MVCNVAYRGLPVDASVGLAQRLDDLQGVQQFVGTPDPQQVLPGQSLPTLKHTHRKCLNA